MPHVHFHLLPRKQRGDRFEGNNDEVYPEIERATRTMPEQFQAANSAPSKARLDQGAEPLKVDADEDRKPRTVNEMEVEAKWLQSFFTNVDDQEID